jgi:hypothetical protein
MSRRSRYGRAAAGVVVVALLIYALASWVQSLGRGAGVTGPGARTSRNDYGESGEPGSGSGTGDVEGRRDAAAPADRDASQAMFERERRSPRRRESPVASGARRR